VTNPSPGWFCHTTPSDYWSTFEEPVPLGTISSF
jgi:hypothetical protein